jgi:predicted lysophospholipase L1 biosynthesis ABC-type transport system permease subunit
MDLKFALRSLRNNPGSGNISVPDFQDWKHQSTAFSATAYYVNYSTVAMTGPAAEWFRTWLLGIFTGLAVCLAMAGVYGVRAYLVGQRSSEIGLRMALGAAPRDVSRLMIRQALRLAAVGLAIGLVGSLAASYFRASRLDPLATLRT